MKFMFSKKHTPFLTLFFLVLMVSSTYAQMEPTGNIAPLLTGRNVLAGSAHNDSPGSSDLTLIVQLKVDGNIVIDEGSSIKVIQPLQNTPVLKPKELPLNSSLGVFGNLSVYTRN